MNKIPTPENSSSLIISDEVIASIAINAAKDVSGVTGVEPHPRDLKSVVAITEESQKYVRVWTGDNEIRLQLFLDIEPDAKIPVVAAEVQESVKNAVQSMTGKVVSKVNIVIAGSTSQKASIS